MLSHSRWRITFVRCDACSVCCISVRYIFYMLCTCVYIYMSVFNASSMEWRWASAAHTAKHARTYTQAANPPSSETVVDLKAQGVLQTEGGVLQTEGGVLQTEGGVLQTEGGVLHAQGGPSQTESGLVQAGCVRVLQAEGGELHTEGYRVYLFHVARFQRDAAPAASGKHDVLSRCKMRLPPALVSLLLDPIVCKLNS
jgi:hypothetical protein